MNEFTSIHSDVAAAQSIRRQYTKKGESNLDKLRSLHEKVKTPGSIISICIGILGTLAMGAGMTNVMIWDNMEQGLILSIPGLIVALLAGPIYHWITESRKKKYGDQIIALCNDIEQK